MGTREWYDREEQLTSGKSPNSSDGATRADGGNARAYLDDQARLGIRLGLENIAALTSGLGQPQSSYPVIHVGGTNGKGSVVAFVERALRAGGHRNGMFVSPKLTDERDQIRIDGAPLTPDSFERSILDVRDVAASVLSDERAPTHFELLTAAALLAFRSHRVTAAVIEVGLGGTSDATNIVTPRVCGITSVGRDHADLLGTTIPEIARHKAGIIKAGVPVVIGALPPEAEDLVREVAANRGSRVVRADEGVTSKVRMDDGRATVEITTAIGTYGPLSLALRGEHQIQNALVAIRLLEEADAAGIRATRDTIEQGLANAEWPARLELLTFDRGRRLLIDAAHNADGAASLAMYLSRWHHERPPLVLAAMRDKDVAAILRALLGAVETVFVTTAPNPRAALPEDLAEAIRSLDPARRVIVEPDPVRAIERAWDESPLVCVAGSIFLAGAVRDALHGRAIVDSPR